MPETTETVLESMTNIIPKINPDPNVLSLDSMRQYYETLSASIQAIVKSLGSVGIVTKEDPKTDATLSVVRSSNPDVFTLKPGMCVNQHGHILTVLEDVEFWRPSAVVPCVVLVTAQLVDSQEKFLSSNNTYVSSGTELKTVVECITLDDYLFRKSIGSFGYSCCVWMISGNNDLVSPTTEYPWLRNWFSFKDHEHRSKLGSGKVTEQNPHGTSIGDILTSGLSLYDLLVSSGMILSKDTSISGVPGYVCYDSFPETAILTDTTGNATRDAFFGGVGSKYVVLVDIPNTVVSCTINNARIPFQWIARTRIIILYTDVMGEVVVGYTKTPSLQIKDANAGILRFAGLSSNEVAVSNGKQVKQIIQSELYLKKYAEIPRNFKIYLSEKGRLFQDPSVLQTQRQLSNNLDKNLLTSSIILENPSKLGIGFHNTPKDGTFQAYIELVGTVLTMVETETSSEVVEQTVTEVLQFNDLLFEDVALPPEMQENQKQVMFTQNSFTKLTSIKLLSDLGVNIEPTTYMLCYAKLDPAKHRLLSVVEGYWNGREVTNVVDSRRVLPTIKEGFYGVTDISSSAEILVGTNELIGGTDKKISLICAEDFSAPLYLDAPTVLWEGVGKLFCDPIKKLEENSDKYRNVYRSCFIPIKKYDAELTSFFVVLHGLENEDVAEGLVRTVLQNPGTTDIFEGCLIPMQNDLSGRIWIGHTRGNYRSVSFVVSGKCRGFSAYFLNNNTQTNPYYNMTLYRRTQP